MAESKNAVITGVGPGWAPHSLVDLPRVGLCIAINAGRADYLHSLAEEIRARVGKC